VIVVRVALANNIVGVVVIPKTPYVHLAVVVIQDSN